MSPEFRGFVAHPRYGQGPRITGLNPENDFATGRVFLHCHVQQRTSQQNLEMAECALSLAEAGTFGTRQLDRVRATLKMIPSDATVQALWARVRALEVG